ncbi:MAG: hypothetical protein B7Y75_05895, partial [Azorhizobium sp. 35-67-5]
VYIGMRSFDRAPISARLLAFNVVMAALVALATFLMPNSPLGRAAVFSIATVAWMGAAAWRLARTPPTGPVFTRLGVAMFLSIFCALHLARLVAIATGNHALLGMPVTEQLAVTLLISLVCGVGLNYGALLMVLDRLASSDELTGLNNRRALLRRGQELLDRTLAYGRPFSVFLVDLDHFKQVNDRFGHRVGDMVLETFAQVARHNLRSGDMIGRYGGEEFCVVLPRTGRAEAAAIAERLRSRVQEDLAMVGGHATHVTVAIGIATLEAGETMTGTIDVLIDAADHALYAAKDGGRNRVVAAAPIGERRDPAMAPDAQPSALH